MEQILKQNHSDQLRVFVVWEPILPTDWSRPSRVVQSRIPDPRAVQFWDNNHLVAKELRTHLFGLQANCCSRAGTLWDVVVVYPKNARWDSGPLYIDGPVVDAAPDAAKQLTALSGAIP
jgi:hypothetical protein